MKWLPLHGKNINPFCVEFNLQNKCIFYVLPSQFIIHVPGKQQIVSLKFQLVAETFIFSDVLKDGAS